MFFDDRQFFDSLVPEVQLILQCSRTKINAEDRDRISALVRNKIDWSVVTENASLWSLLPLLYYNLQSMCADSVPKQILSHMQLSYQQNLVRSMQISAELKKILTLFNENGIFTVPFKGPVLAENLYKNLAYRKASIDMDLFVKRPDVARGRQLLLKLNYKHDCFHPGLSEKHYLRFKSHYLFSRNDALLHRVELHWDIVPRYFSRHIRFKEKLQRCIKVSFSGITAYSLAPEDLLQCLCIHLALHLEKSPFWVCDIAELFSRFTDLQKQTFISQVRQEKMRRVAFLGLALAAMLYDLKLPDDFRREMENDKGLRSLVLAEAKKLLQVPPQGISKIQYAYAYPRYLLRLKDGFNDALHLMTGRLTEMFIERRFISTP